MLKRSVSAFLKDDCTGLSQQVAYSSLLAFFPAVAFLVGALGLFNLFDDVEDLLDPIAPDGVLTFISSLQQDSRGETSAVAFAIGLFAAVWVASGRDALRDQGGEHARMSCRRRGLSGTSASSPSCSSSCTGITTAGVFLLIVVGGALGNAISATARSWQRLQLVVGHPALADRVLRDPALLRSRLLPRAEQAAAQLEVAHARVGRRRAALARSVGPVRALRDVRGELHEDIRRRSPAGSSCCSG